MSASTIYETVPWILGVATVGALLLGGYAWTQRQQPGARWLALMLLIAALWAACDLVSFVAEMPTLEGMLKRFTWWLILGGGYTFLRFAGVHARHEAWWERVRLPVHALIAVNLLLMLTNGQHNLMWASEKIVDLGFARLPWLEPGPAFFWIFRPLAAGQPLAGVVVLLISAFGSPGIYIRQIVTLAIGAAIPVVVNVLFVSTSAPELDTTPVTVVIVVTAFALSTFRFGLLDVMPVARGMLLDQLEDGVIVLDAQCRVVDLNPAAQRLLGGAGFTPGSPVEQLVPFWNEVREGLENGDQPTVETALGGESGRFIELRASRLGGEDGGATGRVLVLHDVSARARLIRELDTYAQTVARDLKAPLQSVIQSLDEFAGSEVCGADATKYLQGADRVCRQMTGTIDALLLFAQLRSTDEVQLEVVDMAKVVEAALHRLSSAIAGAGAEIVVPERWPVVPSRPLWVEEIWTNYLSNAIKYGGRPPHIEIGVSTEQAEVVRYWVRDDGAGLNEQQRAQLFREFTRLDPGRSEGHGLGLSITRRIVEKLGGEVGCESYPGRGSTFWFTLPMGGLGGMG